MGQPEFAGVWPIMPTPLNADGTIDEDGTRRVVNFLVEGGMDGLWMFGTRGEGPNLLPKYHQRELEVAMEASNGRIPIVTGCGRPAPSTPSRTSAWPRRSGWTWCMSPSRTTSR